MAERAVEQGPNCTALVRGRAVICSRCGSLMKAEEWRHSDAGLIPMLLWRCEVGHITQALPLPDAYKPSIALVVEQ